MTDDGQGQDERRVAEIRARHAADSKPWGQECRETGALYPCDTVYLLGRLDALKAERDDALARLAAAEAALAPCTLAREYRDGVTCRDERDDKGVCFNHRVVRGLRVHRGRAAAGGGRRRSDDY